MLHNPAASPAHRGNFPGWGSGQVFSKQQGFPRSPGEAADAAADSPPCRPVSELLWHVCCGKELMASCCVRLRGEVRVGAEEAQEIPLEPVALPGPSSTRQRQELMLPAYDLPVAQAKGRCKLFKSWKDSSFKKNKQKNLPANCLVSSKIHPAWISHKR